MTTNKWLVMIAGFVVYTILIYHMVNIVIDPCTSHSIARSNLVSDSHRTRK